MFVCLTEQSRVAILGIPAEGELYPPASKCASVGLPMCLCRWEIHLLSEKHELSKQGANASVFHSLNRWGHIRAELTGQSHGMNAKRCSVSYWRSALHLPSSLPLSFLPLSFPLFTIHGFVILFWVAVKASEAMLKSGGFSVISWFNSSRSCVYFTFCVDWAS